MRSIIRKIKHGIIYLVAAPAAIIHMAYQVWETICCTIIAVAGFIIAAIVIIKTKDE